VLRSIFEIGQWLPEGIYQRRQGVLVRVPDYGREEVPVGMNCEVTQIDHLTPGDLRILADDFRRDQVVPIKQIADVLGHTGSDTMVNLRDLCAVVLFFETAQ